MPATFSEAPKLKDTSQMVEGDVVILRWRGSNTGERYDGKSCQWAQFVRYTRTGKAILRVAHTNQKGHYLGTYGSRRTFESDEVLAAFDPDERLPDLHASERLARGGEG